jgi:hypothetical protein
MDRSRRTRAAARLGPLFGSHEIFENRSVSSIEEYDEPYYINDQWLDRATRADPECGR